MTTHPFVNNLDNIALEDGLISFREYVNSRGIRQDS